MIQCERRLRDKDALVNMLHHQSWNIGAQPMHSCMENIEALNYPQRCHFQSPTSNVIRTGVSGSKSSRNTKNHATSVLSARIDSLVLSDNPYMGLQLM